MKDLIILTPKLDGDYSDSIVQTVEPFKLTKKHFITVPVQFTAALVIDNKVNFKIAPCNEINLRKYIKKEIGYKDCDGSNIQVYFILNKSFNALKWGFGNLPVHNGKIKDAYHVGARGTLSFTIENYQNLLYSFSMSKNITSAMLYDKIINCVKTVGTSILTSYFADTEISLYEINAHINDIREKMVEALAKEKSISDLGIKTKDLTIEPIFVREDDEDRIHERINKEDSYNG